MILPLCFSPIFFVHLRLCPHVLSLSVLFVILNSIISADSNTLCFSNGFVIVALITLLYMMRNLFLNIKSMKHIAILFVCGLLFYFLLSILGYLNTQVINFCHLFYKVISTTSLHLIGSFLCFFLDIVGFIILQSVSGCPMSHQIAFCWAYTFYFILFIYVFHYSVLFFCPSWALICRIFIF